MTTLALHDHNDSIFVLLSSTCIDDAASHGPSSNRRTEAAEGYFGGHVMPTGASAALIQWAWAPR